MKTKDLNSQQGDALFFKVKSLPKGLKLRKDKIAVEGLNRHIAEGAGVKVYTGFIAAPNGCIIKHPEHKNIKLPKGNYEVKQVMEYDHWKEEARRVID